MRNLNLRNLNMKALALGLAATITLLIAAGPLVERTLFELGIAILIVALPLWAHLSVKGHARQMLHRVVLKESGVLHRWFRGSLLRNLLAFALALVLSLNLVLAFLGIGVGKAFVLLMIAALAGWVFLPKMARPIEREVNADYAPIWTGKYPRRILALLLALASLILGLASPEHLASAEHIEPGGTQSALIGWIVELKALKGAVEDGIRTLFGWPAYPLLYISLFTMWFALLMVTDTFRMSRRDFSRIFAKAAREEGEDKFAPDAGGIFWFVFMAGILVVVLFQVLAGLELWASQLENRYQIGDNIHQASETVTITVEQGLQSGAYYRPGTSQKLAEVQKECIRKSMALASAEVPALAKREFQQVRDGVEGFLDWYYSLGGEYGRLLELLKGNFEEYMQQKLAEHLHLAEANERLITATAKIVEREIPACVSKESAEILARGKITQLPEGAIIARMGEVNEDISQSLQSASLYSREVAQEFVLSNLRRAGGAVGVGIIGAVLMKKVLAKGTLKLAAKAVTKAVASEGASSVAGGGAGALIGGAIGSVVPGLGTVAGAFAGGLIASAATSLLADKMFIEIEEYFARDGMRAQLLSSIDEAEVQVIESLQASLAKASQ